MKRSLKTTSRFRNNNNTLVDHIRKTEYTELEDVSTCRLTGIDRTACARCRTAPVQQILFYRGHDLPIRVRRARLTSVETSFECVIVIVIVINAVPLWRTCREEKMKCGKWMVGSLS